MADHIDWQQVRDVYVEGSLDDAGGRVWRDLDQVCALLEVPYQRAKEHRARDDWDTQRAAHQRHAEAVRQQKRAADLAKEATDFDAAALRAAKLGMQLVTMRTGQVLKKAAQAAKEEADARSRGEEVDDWGISAIDSKEVAALAQAAEGWQRVGAKALGEVETTRTELTGPGGAPLQVQSSIKAELMRDDSDRLHGVIVALEAAGLTELGAGARALPAPGDDEADSEG